MQIENSTHRARRAPVRHTALAVALGLAFSGGAMAQAVTGSIYGQAPAASGETVQVSSSATGVTREVAVGADGRYQVGNLPVGTYTVTLKQDGKPVTTHENASVTSGATGVDFVSANSANAKSLGTVTVSANALPPIDVTNTNSGTVITAAELQKLPITRNAESIALLAPNTVSGSSFFSGPGGNALVSFGGSSVSENAYYVNGFNTAEPYKNLGGFQLPYGAIQQQETLTGGYDAQYGRSDGGVISQIGQRGTNEWHFGGQVVWQPRYLESNPDNNVYGNPYVPPSTSQVNYALEEPTKPGTLRQYRNENKQWETIYSAYVGGPLIKDKLFIFLAPEVTKTRSTLVGVDTNAPSTNYSVTNQQSSKFYGKIDWNITDSNILELTTLRNSQRGLYAGDGAGSLYAFDYATRKFGAYSGPSDAHKDNAQFYIGHFTSYITDAATLSVLFGKANFQNPIAYGNTSPLPFISRPYNEVLPNGTQPNLSNNQTNTSWISPDAKNATRGLRVDFDYKLGSHDLAAGIDNMFYRAHDQGISQTNPFNPSLNYYWRYLPGGVVQKREIGWATSMTTAQKAYYLQDTWQVSSTVLLKVGVRNEHYTNYNDLGEAFTNQINQWEPRVGATWDVNGDSSFKVYGNVGRYYLALPDDVAERAANRSYYLTTNYSYTGIDGNGVPTGLTQLHATTSPDGETGSAKDPQQVTARNLKPEYVDEYIVGFDKQLNAKWNYGAKAMWRNLKVAIDDECQPGLIAAKMATMGLNPANYSNSLYGANYCRLINPGKTNDMLLVSDDGSARTIVPMTQHDWGYINGARRKIASLDLYLEHPFDGKWMARMDYTYTHGWGNTEGQVRSDFGQQDISKTEDWDSWQLMNGQDGELINTRKHQFRFRGAYEITPEWLLSATMLAQSGLPQECLGYYGPGGSGAAYYGPGEVGDPSGYNNFGSGNYHWCHGIRMPPGSIGHTPWTFPLNLGVHYRPDFAQQKMTVSLDVFNLFDQQRPVQTDAVGENAYSASTNTIYINNTYGQGIYFQNPRTVRLTLTYDY
ncbi:TonB-dependent receptor [Dyella sp. 2HG41-7]|uniref:TonB-dependent receptor n=1 Tax=Dyella sp. 2HG41-7 TaxID=2883239 RepID=UPI001F3732B1|nr:TonB-dependent receptor [Dyella sp. 2HG41-7]